VIKRGYKPFVVIRHENEASKSLYKKLGFEKEFEMARIVFTPYEQDEKIVEESIEYQEKSSSKNYGNGRTNGNHVNGKPQQF
jgi:predicted RecB family endonuclease